MRSTGAPSQEGRASPTSVPISASYKYVGTDIKALGLKVPGDRAAEFAHWHSVESIAQRFARYAFILAASHELEWQFVYGREDIPNLPRGF